MRDWTQRLRQLTAAAAAALTAPALLLCAATPAAAGGPTSVLVVSPTSGETASLYHSDREYTQLERLLAPADTGTRARPPEAALASGRQVNVTWMVHDVTPWRVHQIHLPDGARNVWVHTSTHVTDGDDGVWHGVKDPYDLRKFLYGLGVTGPATGHRTPAVDPVPPDDGQAAPDGAGGTAPVVSAARQTAGDGTGWWWAIPGLAAGAVLALLLRPHALRGAAAVRGRRDGDGPGPRQQLLDH
ncbi:MULTISPECIES: hypothetical protein [Streptomyces]|uniref:hypothetical protein n=1 Tax=Streptomyces TaxID=1883 RepID=UPI001F11385A|nr:hypothetical protein [Streptomyces tendae]